MKTCAHVCVQEKTEFTLSCENGLDFISNNISLDNGLCDQVKEFLYNSQGERQE